MRKLAVLLAIMIAAACVVSACSKNQGSSSSSENSATTAPESSPMSGMNMAAKLPIPLSKLPTATVAPGNATAGAAVFSANCASCHGEGGKNGQVGPTLAGAGLKAGQVAYMVRNPQAIDKDSGMPKLPLTDKQLADVAAYVASLK